MSAASSLARVLGVFEGVTASGLVVASDFDGTLAPIVPRPADARAPEGTVRALRQLSGCLRGVAVISGRDSADLAARLGLPAVRMVGNYGLEWRDGARWEIAPDARKWPERIRAAVQTLERDPRVRTPGVSIEAKALSLSVHFRSAPRPEQEARRLELAVREHGDRQGLTLHPGRRVWELRPAVPMDKGRALAALLDAWRPLAAVYAGDDISDLPAWRVVRHFDGPAVAVGVRSTEVPDAAYADCSLLLASPAEMGRFLTALSARFCR